MSAPVAALLFLFAATPPDVNDVRLKTEAGFLASLLPFVARDVSDLTTAYALRARLGPVFACDVAASVMQSRRIGLMNDLLACAHAAVEGRRDVDALCTATPGVALPLRAACSASDNFAAKVFVGLLNLQPCPVALTSLEESSLQESLKDVTPVFRAVCRGVNATLTAFAEVRDAVAAAATGSRGFAAPPAAPPLPMVDSATGVAYTEYRIRLFETLDESIFASLDDEQLVVKADTFEPLVYGNCAAIGCSAEALALAPKADLVYEVFFDPPFEITFPVAGFQNDVLYMRSSVYRLRTAGSMTGAEYYASFAQLPSSFDFARDDILEQNGRPNYSTVAGVVL